MKMKSVSHAETAQTGQDITHTKGYLRIVSLLDEGSFHEIDGLAKSQGGYAEAVAGYGTVEGCPVCVFSQNSDVAGGAMSKAQASKIKKVYQLAVKTGTPVIGIFDSAGGRLDENGDILEAYGEILLHANNISGVVPQISLILGPCMGTSAMIAAGLTLSSCRTKGNLPLPQTVREDPRKRPQRWVCAMWLQLMRQKQSKRYADWYPCCLPTIFPLR
jgi:methylmalonyl-CoA decarboxylase subunit alpha